MNQLLDNNRERTPQEEYLPTKFSKFWSKVADTFTFPFAIFLWGGLGIITLLVFVAIVIWAISVVF
jgi:hypothetical protein